MPHNELGVNDLDQQYPSLEAVEYLDLPDISRLEDDRLYAAAVSYTHLTQPTIYSV